LKSAHRNEGGVFTPEDAKTSLESGANLVQIYTVFTYNGPTLLDRINRYLSDNQVMEQLNYSTAISQAPVRDGKDIVVTDIETETKVELDANSGASFHAE